MMLGRQNEFHWLGTVGAQRERLWTRSGRLAKAKVAGSNPVFRSKSPGFRALGGSGLFHGLRLSWRRRPFTTVAGGSGSSRRTGPLADRSDAIPWQSGTRMEHLPPPKRTSSSALRLRSEEHTSELQSRLHLVCRLLLEKK